MVTHIKSQKKLHQMSPVKKEVCQYKRDKRKQVLNDEIMEFFFKLIKHKLASWNYSNNKKKNKGNKIKKFM